MGGQDGPSDDFYGSETLTRIVGKHQIKFGGEFRYGISASRTRWPASTWPFQFSRNFTSLRPNVANLTTADGGPLASFLLGYMASNSVGLSPSSIGAAITVGCSSRMTGG